MIAAQSAIGAVNDIVDRDLDAAAKPWKPIPAGAVALVAARRVAAVAMAAALALGPPWVPRPGCYRARAWRSAWPTTCG
ncbi:MAG: UbiA family prenyltransferase [Dehalococcoidia bacterium]